MEIMIESDARRLSSADLRVHYKTLRQEAHGFNRGRNGAFTYGRIKLNTCFF